MKGRGKRCVLFRYTYRSLGLLSLHEREEAFADDVLLLLRRHFGEGLGRQRSRHRTTRLLRRNRLLLRRR